METDAKIRYTELINAHINPEAMDTRKKERQRLVDAVQKKLFTHQELTKRVDLDNNYKISTGWQKKRK